MKTLMTTTAVFPRRTTASPSKRREEEKKRGEEESAKREESDEREEESEKSWEATAAFPHPCGLLLLPPKHEIRQKIFSSSWREKEEEWGLYDVTRALLFLSSILSLSLSLSLLLLLRLLLLLLPLQLLIIAVTSNGGLKHRELKALDTRTAVNTQ